MKKPPRLASPARPVRVLADRALSAASGGMDPPVLPQPSGSTPHDA